MNKDKNAWAGARWMRNEVQTKNTKKCYNVYGKHDMLGWRNKV